MALLIWLNLINNLRFIVEIGYLILSLLLLDGAWKTLISVFTLLSPPSMYSLSAISLNCYLRSSWGIWWLLWWNKQENLSLIEPNYRVRAFSGPCMGCWYFTLPHYYLIDMVSYLLRQGLRWKQGLIWIPEVCAAGLIGQTQGIDMAVICRRGGQGLIGTIYHCPA